ncbi:glycosyltransferase [Maribius pontilimi]|uniref:Glycosyltransferase n=1 Tax=Palleronia pontilimi TaxID=1964209 RepID=A0A934IDS9_9RHOB|nr:cellulose synthase catalytic subunit [Palleronia pontilimi]MBJ3763791.1 glycosyltransferase [Palleronia pontilimi]
MLDIVYLSAIESSLARVALVLGIALALPFIFDKSKTTHRTAVFAVAALLAGRYLWWRATVTIAPLGLTWDFLASWSLLAIETAAIASSLSSFAILSRIKQRSSEATAKLDWWAPYAPPRVAVLIATYNETLDVLERTIIGAKALNHPAKQILVLDDGRRDWLRDYCAAQGVRYLVRPDNKGSKAGNINHAIATLSRDAQPPDFVAVLDADFVPHRGFLSRSLALFKSRSVGLVQTPQHFFNADPIQHNLGLNRSYPDEQRLFFDHLQPARDAWGIAFCCGTSSVVRWTALRAVGGFPEDSVTEDFMMTLVLRDGGWDTVYLNEPLTEGLAPEGLKEYVTQRARWCLGMMQIARSRVGPFARNNLRLRDRWSIIDAVLYWTTTFPFRLATLIYPLLYWYFNITVVNATVADVISFFGVYYLWILLAMGLVARGLVVPVLNDVSQILGALPITRAAFTGLLKPHGHPFQVTAKGGQRDRIVVQWRLLLPYLVLFALTLGGLLIGIFADRFAFNDAGQGKQVVLFWTLYNMVVLATTILAFVELPRSEVHVADRPEPARLTTPEGVFDVMVEGLTLDTLRVSQLSLPQGTVGTVALDGVGDVRATVIGRNRRGNRLRLQTTEAQKEALILKFYTDGGSPGIAAAKFLPVARDAALRLMR